jgi:hypothetical protein
MKIFNRENPTVFRIRIHKEGEASLNIALHETSKAEVVKMLSSCFPELRGRNRKFTATKVTLVSQRGAIKVEKDFRISFYGPSPVEVLQEITEKVLSLTHEPNHA